MAENSLASALNLQFAPSENTWGISQGLLAQTAPKLISDYRSTGANLGIGLGSILMSALLGYQARSQATKDTLSAMELANTMQAQATTPEARVSFLKNLEGSDVDTDVLAKVSSLASALSTQDRLTALEDAKRQKQAEWETYAKIGAEQGIAPADVAEWTKKRREAMAALRAGGEQTGVPIEFQTADEIKAAQEREAKKTELIRQSRGKLQEDPVYKNVQEARPLLQTAADLAKDDTGASDDGLIKIVERIGNPGNQVTLEEFKRGNVNTLFQGVVGSARRMMTAKGNLNPESRRQLLEVAKTFTENMKDVYNSRLRAEMNFLKLEGIKDPLPNRVGPSRLFYTPGERTQIESKLQALTAKEQDPATPDVEKVKASTLKQQILDLLANKQNYYEQD